MYKNLLSLRSQREVGEVFNFLWAVYTVIPKDGSQPRYLQPGKSKTAAHNLAKVLTEVKKNGDMVIAAWVGQYKTDMFLIDDIDTVIAVLEGK